MRTPEPPLECVGAANAYASASSAAAACSACSVCGVGGGEVGKLGEVGEVGCDVVIDATGDVGVHAQLTDEPRLSHVRLAWCYIKPGPAFGLLAMRRPDSAITLTAAEQALRAALRPEVWTDFEAKRVGDDGLVWPTPGCYHPTFDAAYHGMRLMAD